MISHCQVYDAVHSRKSHTTDHLTSHNQTSNSITQAIIITTQGVGDDDQAQTELITLSIIKGQSNHAQSEH